MSNYDGLLRIKDIYSPGVLDTIRKEIQITNKTWSALVQTTGGNCNDEPKNILRILQERLNITNIIGMPVQLLKKFVTHSLPDTTNFRYLYI